MTRDTVSDSTHNVVVDDNTYDIRRGAENQLQESNTHVLSSCERERKITNVWKKSTTSTQEKKATPQRGDGTRAQHHLYIATLWSCPTMRRFAKKPKLSRSKFIAMVDERGSA